MGVGRADPLDGQQGGRPRARHLHHEDRLPPRPDGGPPVDRRDLLPRTARRPAPTSRATSASCPASGPAAAATSATQYDAFRTGDPAQPGARHRRRVCRASATTSALQHLDVVEGAFARGRRSRAEATAAPRDRGRRARKMMSSEQLKAFDVSPEPLALRRAYGDTPFGRGCLAARRLTEVGVRCVEVTLAGWDTHANNHAGHRNLLAILDPAFSALIRDLRERELLERTRRAVRRRVRPDAEDQPGGRPRPLAHRLQRGPGRRRRPRRPGRRRDRPRRQGRSRPTR